MMLQQLNIVLDEFEMFQDTHSDSDTRLHTKYLHSYIAFRVTSWFLNSAKKIDDDQGRAIPFGDPENILGTRWMGFENSPGARGYGIHGTARPETIGRDEKTTMAIMIRVSSVAASIGVLKAERMTTSANVIAIIRKSAVTASIRGRVAASFASRIS